MAEKERQDLIKELEYRRRDSLTQEILVGIEKQSKVSTAGGEGGGLRNSSLAGST